MWAAHTWTDKVRVWFAEPGWDPVTHQLKAAPQVDRSSYRKFDTRVPTGLNVYVAAQFVPIVAASTALMYWQDTLGELVAIIGALLVLLSVLVWGGLFELKRWALPLEVLRIALILTGVLVLLSNATLQPAFAYPALAASLVFLGWILRYRELFRTTNAAA